jgi:hypothetical protein
MSDSYDDYESKMQLAEHAWEQALETEQEPVAWLDPEENISDEAFTWSQSKHHTVPLYTAPPKAAEWVGLTDEEVMVAAWKAGFDIHEDYDNDDDPEAMHWWSADGEVCDDSLLKLRDLIEAKLKEKNT